MPVRSAAFFLFFFGTVLLLASSPSFAALSADTNDSVNSADGTNRTATLPTSAPIELSLKAAAEKAIELNPQLNEKKEHVNEMAEHAPLAEAQLLPTIKYSANEARVKDPLVYPFELFNGAPYNRYQDDLNVTQPLFAFGSISAIRASKIDRTLSVLDVKIARRDLLNQLIQAYYQVVVTTRNKQILEDEFKILKKTFRTTAHRARIGRNQVLDALQTKTQVALLDSQISDATSQYEVAVAQLANLLGAPKLGSFKMKNSLKVPSLASVDKMVQPRLKAHVYEVPEVEEDELNLKKIDYQKDATLGENLPNLQFVGDMTNYAFKKSDMFSPDSAGWDVELELNVPLFSGFSTLYQMREFASQELQTELDRQNVENQMNYQQVSARKTLESAERSILSGETALKLGRASSEEAQRNYRYATIDILQFLQVESSYMQAESTLNTYKYNYLVALSQYFVASGQPMMDLIDLLEEVNK